MNLRFSLGIKIAALFGIVALLMVASVGLSLRLASEQNARLADVSDVVDSVVLRIVPLQQRIAAIRFDVVQVQQWLTDVSATRGLDGLDDGPRLAADFAGRFRADVAEARRLAGELGLADVTGALAAVEAAFVPYYDQGRAMADAYVRGGPADGNRLMGEFDATSEVLQDTVEALVDAVATSAGSRLAALRGAVGDIERAGDSMVDTNVSVLVLVVMVAAGSLWYVRRAVVRPLVATTRAMTALARREATFDLADIADRERRDEIGRMQEALRIFLEQARENERLRQARDEEQARADVEKQRALAGMARTVEEEAGRAVAQVSEHTGSLRTSANGMASSADLVARDAQSVAAAADQTLGNTETLQAAATQLAGAIGAIGRQVDRADSATRRGVDVGGKAADIVGHLSETVAKIGEVADLIAGIASQTNLLALNATIEAARAGEAGTGFAVVANEVKNLANQTASSTEEITRQIAAVQDQTGSAVAAVRDMVAVIHDVAAVATSIAGAVDQQSAATRDIVRTVEETASAARVVADRIAGVHREAVATGRNARTVLGVATEVADGVDALKRRIVDIVQAAAG